MQQQFHELADHATSLLRGNEIFTATLDAEDSQFCRLNHTRIRQAGSVRQAQLNLRLINGRRNASATLTLSESPETDRTRLAGVLSDLRAQLDLLPDDPHLLYATEPCSTETIDRTQLPDAREVIATVLADPPDSAAGLDLVGIYASGPVWRGFANSMGQRNWHERVSFNFDFSCYLHEDKAVKKSLAGTKWEPEAFAATLDAARRELELLQRPARTISPGAYRTYLAPAALKEIAELLSWDAFSARAHCTRQTPLLRLIDGQQTLSAAVTLHEDTARGLAPDFDDAGFIRPATVTLIDGGKYRDCMVSARSAREFGLAANGADGRESPESLSLQPGELALDDVAAALDDGLWINNLWYLNYSDRDACRITGITRFACFVVENGRVIAPLNVMRFDDSLLRMLGPHLLGLTQETEWLASPSTYGARSTDSMRLPGALIERLNLTL